MKNHFIEMLRCPLCQSMLKAEDVSDIGKENFMLIDSSGHRFPVVNGIPRFGGNDGQTQDASSLASFNFQYGKEDWIFDYDVDRVEQLFNKVFKINPDEVQSKKVIVIGCGNGPEIYGFSQMAPECVIGIDLTDGIADAAQNTSNFDNVLIMQADAAKPPLSCESMDILYCDGVLPHTQDPKEFLRKILTLVKPGGVALIRTLLVPDSLHAKLHLFPRQVARMFTKRLPSTLLWNMCHVGAVLNTWLIVGWILRKLVLYYDPGNMSVHVTQLINFRMYGNHQFRHHLPREELLRIIDSALPGSKVEFDGAVFRIRNSGCVL